MHRRYNKLVALLGAMMLLVPAASWAAGTISRIRALSSQPTLVWSWPSLHDPTAPTFTGSNGSSNTFDAPIKFFRDADGNLFTIAANGVNYRLPFTASFLPARALTSADKLFDSSKTVSAGAGQYFHVGNANGYLSGSCVEADYDNLIWVFGLWSDDGRAFSALAHHEFYPDTCPQGSLAPWITATHHLTSNNGGASFLPAAYTPYAQSGLSNAGRLVLVPRPSGANDPQYVTYGFLHPSNIVKEGSYHYATVMGALWTGQVNAQGHGLNRGGLVMIRTLNPATPGGWQVYTSSGWQAINRAMWQGLGDASGGQGVKLFLEHANYDPYTEYPRGGQNMTYSLVQHLKTGKWIAFGHSNQGATTVQYSVSDSLANPNWGPITVVEGAPVLQSNQYASLVSHGDFGYVFQYVNDTPYLYYVQEACSGVPSCPTDWHDRSIYRIPLQIDTTLPAKATVRYTASTGYSANQGQSQWRYLDSTGAALTYDATTGWWKGSEAYVLLWSTGGHPGATRSPMRRWTAPAAGFIRITGSARHPDVNGDGVNVSILKDGKTYLWQRSIPAGNTSAFPYDVNAVVQAGETIDFIIHRGPASNGYDSTDFDPTVDFTPY